MRGNAKKKTISFASVNPSARQSLKRRRPRGVLITPHFIRTVNVKPLIFCFSFFVNIIHCGDYLKVYQQVGNY